MNTFILMDPFELSLAYLLQDEGLLYTDDPSDNGGPTKFGVTQKSYSDFVGSVVTDEEMSELTLDDIKPFYRAKYWDVIQGDEVSKGYVNVSIALFDTAVLYGPESAVMLAQKACVQMGTALKIDGMMGTKTIEALCFNGPAERDAWFSAFYLFILHRINEIIRDNPQDEKFRNGWMNRAHRLSQSLNTDTPFHFEDENQTGE